MVLHSKWPTSRVSSTHGNNLTLNDMKLSANILAIMLCFCLQAEAQTFTSRLQKVGNNQARRTITQSSEIEKLVNGNSANPQADNNQTAAPNKTQNNNSGHSKPQDNNSRHGKPQDNKTTENAPQQNPDDNDLNEGNNRKVMGNGRKVMGYRVQAFAGGNTRADRTKAHEVSNTIKKRFPNEPVYVHFYSPRWICRVGNYRTYEEAHQMLTEIRDMGFSQAFIVKGKITVRY